MFAEFAMILLIRKVVKKGIRNKKKGNKTKD